MYMGLLRNSEVRYVVLDTNGNELGVIADYGVCTKGFWDTDTRDQLGVTYGQFPGNYNFSQYNRSDLIVRIEAKLDNNGMHTTNAFSEEASENWKWDIPLHIDTQAPSVSNFSAANGKFTFNVTDEHYVAYVGVFTNNDGNLGNCQDEIAVMDGGKCILQLRGVRPFLSDKYDITKHPNYKYLSDFDKRNAFDVERYMSTRPAIVKPDEAFDIYEIDLSDEDAAAEE